MPGHERDVRDAESGDHGVLSCAAEVQGSTGAACVAARDERAGKVRGAFFARQRGAVHYIEAADNTGRWMSGGKRYASVYNIDYSRCIFCGYCVEACPTDAITHGHGFELASFNVTLIYRRSYWRRHKPGGRVGAVRGRAARALFRAPSAARRWRGRLTAGSFELRGSVEMRIWLQLLMAA